jgi:hypothetical protein
MNLKIMYLDVSSYLMADEMELQYNTPQDKLLIMLLERISALEDEQSKLRQAVEQSNANLETLWSKSSSVFFGICIRGKCQLPVETVFGGFGFASPTIFGGDVIGQQYSFTSEQLQSVKNIITDTFPQSLLTVTRNQFVNIYFEFETPMLLDTVKEALELKLLHHVHILTWSTLSKSEMASVLRSNPFQV